MCVGGAFVWSRVVSAYACLCHPSLCAFARFRRPRQPQPATATSQQRLPNGRNRFGRTDGYAAIVWAVAGHRQLTGGMRWFGGCFTLSFAPLLFALRPACQPSLWRRRGLLGEGARGAAVRRQSG